MKAFSLALPPPNVTGTLHLGHALTVAVQDAACRWARMRGARVCWVPGTDHAGIATQVVVEKGLAREGLTRERVGRAEFERRCAARKDASRARIGEQLRAMGATLDWSREAFTMDERRGRAVREAFVRLHDAGSIYRAEGLVNWSCALRSAISDAEVRGEKLLGKRELRVPGYETPVDFGLMYEFAYRTDDGNEIIVATTRPETMLGDVAVAVHPEDERHSRLIGRRVLHPFSKKNLPIIADASVDREFGTGAVKITPSHDRDDADLARRHDLGSIAVVGEDGTIEKGHGEFSGMKRYDARENILARLKELGLLRRIYEHETTVPICERSGDVVEPLPRPQWYVDCKRLSRKALEHVRTKRLELLPERFEATWTSWAEKERDWCISRQLWWGHRVPAYRCRDASADSADTIWVAAHDLLEAQTKASKLLDTSQIVCEQDEDALDTWFSSSLYPFSIHGWPTERPERDGLYPLSVMITGHDILGLWVHRMVMMGIALTGRLPFPKALLHGIVCDASGAKMSKSKGNTIDPGDVIAGISLEGLQNKAKASYDEGLLNKQELEAALVGQKKRFPNGIPACGSDALRFTLCTRNVKNMYVNFDVDDCVTNNHFCNKMRQSVKYFRNVMNSTEPKLIEDCCSTDLQSIDRWLLSRLAFLVSTVNNSMETFDYHLATTALRQFLYNEMCDVYIEFTKYNLRVDMDKKKLALNCHAFSACFGTALRLLSPFMPNITTELIETLPQIQNCIVNYKDDVNSLKAPREIDFLKWKNEALEKEYNAILEVISTIRHLKHTHKITKDVKPSIIVQASDDDTCDLITKQSHIIKFTSNCSTIITNDGSENPSNMSSRCCDDSVKIYLVNNESKKISSAQTKINNDAILEKKAKLLKKLEKLEKTMAASGFIKAPSEVQVSYKNKIKGLKDDLKRLEDLLV